MLSSKHESNTNKNTRGEELSQRRNDRAYEIVWETLRQN